MRVFEMLRALRTFEKRDLPFIASLQDFDLLIEIGYHQEIGAPLSSKRLYLLEIGSVATVQRRLAELKLLGVVTTTRSAKDARSVEWRISPKVWTTYQQHSVLLGRGKRSSR